jgi:AcrR family transcriptional regulator
VTDEAITAAAATVIGRLGPGKLTLAGVGREIGPSAATLVQRFGSKRGLLLAMVKSAADSVDDCFEMVRAAHQSPLTALVAAATDLTRGSLISWAVFRQESAAAWVRTDVDTVLEPYRLRSPRASRARQSMRRALRRAQR